MLRSTAASAGVSTSSGEKTLLTPCSRISPSVVVCAMELLPLLLESHALVLVKAAHIRQDDHVAHLETAQDLDMIHGGPPQSNGHALGEAAARREPEHAPRLPGRAVPRPADVERVLDPIELD